MIERGAERVEIAPCIGAFSFDLFQRSIVGRVSKDAACCPAYADVTRHSFGQTEIQKDDLTSLRQFQILGFDIAVDYRRSPSMQIFQNVQQLACPRLDQVRRERAARGL